MRFALFVSLLLPAAPALAAPGQLLSAEPVAGAPEGGRAWRIRYLTSDERGADQEATGMVIAPRESGRGGRVIAWTHGTWGVADKCAPSRGVNFFNSGGVIAPMLARGYAIVAPDYAGLGGPGPHGYLVGGNSARSVLDAVRAARAVDSAFGTRFAVWGESEGGHAALFTGLQAKAYAPELRLVGTAAAAPPTDLAANLSGSTPVKAFLSAFVINSWTEYYGIDKATLVNASTAGVIDRLANNNCITLDAKPKLGTILGIGVVQRAMRKSNLATTPPWSDYARRNSPASSGFAAPVLIAQAVSDPLVNPAVTRAYARKLCATGTRVRWIDIPGKAHESSARDSAAATLDWIGDRFAGQSPPDDCKSL